MYPIGNGRLTGLSLRTTDCRSGKLVNTSGRVPVMFMSVKHDMCQLAHCTSWVSTEGPDQLINHLEDISELPIGELCRTG